MRLFIYAIGGTGARVVKSLVMLCAAGVRPTDSEGHPIQNLEIVPMIVDPHHANEDLKRAESLLETYRAIRHQIHGDEVNASGFFAVPIRSLKSLQGDSAKEMRDSFLFNLSAVERLKFHEFIDYNSLNESNQAMMSLMFSPAHLDTSMHIGFVGAPNIGSIALGKFKESDEFHAFANVIDSNDRIFFISSIFGGTGAAGFPTMVKNIRHADRLDVANKGYLMNARIGALTVLPYFNLEHSESSPIDKADFILKTRSALHYYDKTMTGEASGAVNAIYYLGDKTMSSPYINDPGAGGQKNAAHLVELIGATAPINFLSMTDEQLSGEHTQAFEFGLEHDTAEIDFTAIDSATRALIALPMIKFHLLSLFLDHKFESCVGRGFTKDTPQIGNDFLSSEFYRLLTKKFLPMYWDWLEEMDGNHRHVNLFDLDNNDRLESLLRNISPAKGLLGVKRLTYDHIFSAINSEAKKYNGKFSLERLPLKLMTLFNLGAEEIVKKRFGGAL